MKEIDGDLIALAREGHFDLIAHGCNCFCTMGARIARGIRAAFPEAYEADLNTKKGDRAKLRRICQLFANSASKSFIFAHLAFLLKLHKPLQLSNLAEL